MTRVIIEGIQNRASLINAISVVLRTMNADGAFDKEEQLFVPDRDEDEQVGNEPPPLGEESDENQGPYAGLPWPPLPYIACANRGTHETLTECWMCWSDVMRGAAIEPEVLSAKAWI